MTTQSLLKKVWRGALTIAMLAIAGRSEAQVNLYAFSQSNGTYSSIAATGTVLAKGGASSSNPNTYLDDNNFAATIPFSFTFNGSSYTAITVNTNGWISFGSTAPASNIYTAISNTASVPGFVAAFNRDLDGRFQTTASVVSASSIISVASTAGISVGDSIAGTGIPALATVTAIGGTNVTLSAPATASGSSVAITVYSGLITTAVSGTSPNRVFTIEWKNFSPYNTSNNAYNFQIQLAEGGGLAPNQTVKIVYGPYTSTTSGSVQVGLRGATNTDFNDRTSSSSWTATTAGTSNSATVSYSSTNVPPSGLTFTYTPVICSGAPTAGTATAGATTLCTGFSTLLTLTGTTVASGISIQWQSSTDNITFTDITGATSSTVTVTPATSPTYYLAKVTCSTTTNSSVSNTITITVADPTPVVATLPFTESFESWVSSCATTDRPGVNWLTNPSIGNNAWRRDDQGASANWTAATSGIYSPVFTSGAHSARFHSARAGSGVEGIMDVYLDLRQAGAKLITFDHINTSGTDTLFVEFAASSAGPFTQLGFVAISPIWSTYNFTTTSTSTAAVIRLRAKSDFGSTDIGVDNFMVSVPTCLPPTALTATSITTSGASLGFTVAGTPSAYQIQYGSTTFAPGAGTNVFTTSNPYVLTGLSFGTNYSFFVRAICGPGDTSAYSQRFVFSTACGNVPLPFLEVFNTYLPNNCWSEAVGQLTASATLTGTSSLWTGANYLNSSSITNPAARVNLSSNTRREWVISPSIDLGTPAAGTSYGLIFNAGFVNSGGTTPTKLGSDDTVAVVVSTDNGVTWSKSNIVKLFTAANTPVSTSGGLRFAVPLEGYSGVIKLGFYGSDGSVSDAPNVDVFIDSVYINNCVKPTVFLGNDTNICSNNPLTINAGNAGSTYLYSNGDTTQTSRINATGSYNVRVVSQLGCAGRDTINVFQIASPVVNLGNDTTICPATTITLNAGNAGSSFLYSNSATTQTTAITTGGTYSVRVTNAQNCVGRDTIVITQGVNPVVNLGNDTTICFGTVLTINAGNPGSTYLYSNLATTQTTNIVTPTVLSVAVTNATKCVGRDTININVVTAPVVNLGRDTTVCPGATITLNAGNPGNTYLYSNAATTQTTSITAGGTYTVAVTSVNGCIGRDTIIIAQGVIPVVNLGNDTVLCPAQTITLNAGNAGSTYLYSNAATTQTTAITAAGTYSVAVTNPGRCVGRDTIVITGGTNPVVNLGNDTTLCPLQTITLNAGNPGNTYLYSNAATTQTTGVTAGGTYTVAVTNAQKCVGRDTIVITAVPNPVVNLGNDTVLCPAQTITLNAGNPGSAYLFSNAATTQTTAVTTIGTYSVRVTDVNKCIGRDTIVITAGTNPVVNLGNDSLLCPGDTIRLNAGNAGSTYLYSTGATTQIAPVTAGGTYTVAVTNTSKCVGRDTIVFSTGVNPVPRLGNDTTLCPAQTITLNGGTFSPGFAYLYSNAATTQTTNITSAGTYTLRVTNLTTGCRGRDTIVVFAGVNPVVNLGNDTVICPGKTITLNAGNAGSTYLYNTGATTQTLPVTAAGTYSVRVTNVTKCIGRDTIVISQGTNPIVNLGNDTSACTGIAITLDAGNPGSTYLYSTGATTRTLSVIPSGSYSVAVTNAQNCVGRDTINITIIPTASVHTITAVRTGLSVAFTSDAQATTTYLWEFGDGGTDNTATPTHTYTANGNYVVKLTVTNQCGSVTITTIVNITGVGTGTITLSNKELSIYPNPATTSITLENKSGLKMQSATVLNVLGEVMFTKDGIAPNKETIDISALPAGTYMVRIQTDGGTFLRRVQVVN